MNLQPESSIYNRDVSVKLCSCNHNSDANCVLTFLLHLNRKGGCMYNLCVVVVVDGMASIVANISESSVNF